MHLACVLKHFVETCLKKKQSAKNDVFMSNFHFGKCVEITGKNRLEIRFETLCGDKFEKKNV